MKRIILILCLCLAVFTSFGKKVVVIEVNKEGSSWQNLFNCYQRVTTNYLGENNGVTQVSLNCEGGGFNWCRASREIGSTCYSAPNHDLLSNPTVIRAINSLIETSEQQIQKSTYRGTASQKVAISNGRKSTLYFIKANWQYNPRNCSEGRIIITIETDDNDMLQDTAH
jgi:hypothetical protein